MNTILSLYQKQLETNAGGPLLTVVDSRLNSAVYDLCELYEKSSRAAGCLKDYGCEKGDRVLISARETVSVWSFFWGALKLGAVPCVLFPELGMGGLEVRLKAAKAHFLVTDADPVKIEESITFCEPFKRGILLGKESSKLAFPHFRNIDWEKVSGCADVDENDAAFMVFTSGTTGTPKPVVHRHGIADAIVRSMTEVLHADPSDTFWCTAHPAWITGTVYGILGPILCGIPSVQYEGKFHAKRWMPILQDRKVSLWYTAPTAMRGLMREDDDFFKNYDFSSLKQIYSIGEPLPPKVFEWGQRIFHKPVYDTWFQTECGTIRIANQPGQPLKPGWMGKPVDDTFVKVANSSGPGKLYLKAGFDSMFAEYYGMPEASSEKVSDGWFETGDLVTADPDGCLHYEGRADDVINTSGHLVSPLEVEQVLTANQKVAAAAVTAEPDELLYEAPVAFLVLAGGCEWDRPLETSLKVAVNNGVSPYAVPKHFYIVSELPLTGSGKINRSELRKKLADGSF